MSSKRKQGFTLVEIMIVVAIIAILAAVGIPAFIQYRTTAVGSTCNSNLRQILTAKESWAAPQVLLADDSPVTEGNITPFLRGNIMPSCPQQGTYTIGNLDVLPDCSIHGELDLTPGGGGEGEGEGEGGG